MRWLTGACLRRRLAGSRVDAFRESSAGCADAPACRHTLVAQGPLLGALIGLSFAFREPVGPGPCAVKLGVSAWPWTCVHARVY